MASSHIIPIPAASNDDPVVLVEVAPNGKHPLDVRLIGCEGENGYVADIKHRNIGKLRKHNFKGTDDEWEALLAYFLLQKQPEGDQAKILDDVRTVYTIKGEKLEISIRRVVQGIKVILGEIVLEYNEEEEIEPFKWAQISAEAHSNALEEIARLKTEFSTKQDTIDRLKAQLQDFIKTKNEAETAMLQQFMELLNEKKRKIRDQNRLLAGSKVDKAAASSVKAVREETKPRKAGPSRSSKRKTPAKAPVVEEEEGDSDQMEIDEAKEEEQDDDSIPEAATPERGSEDETEDEGDAPARPSASSAPQTKQRATETSGRITGNSPKAGSPPDGPPPIRELPFHRSTTRSKAGKKQAATPPADEDDETEDEL